MKTGALKQGFRKKEAVELPAKRENVYARHRKKPPERPVAGGLIPLNTLKHAVETSRLKDSWRLPRIRS
jgi:hypothetical protein